MLGTVNTLQGQPRPACSSKGSSSPADIPHMVPRMCCYVAPKAAQSMHLALLEADCLAVFALALLVSLVPGNTQRAHRLMSWAAKEHGLAKQNALAEQLFEGYHCKVSLQGRMLLQQRSVASQHHSQLFSGLASPRSLCIPSLPVSHCQVHSSHQQQIGPWHFNFTSRLNLSGAALIRSTLPPPSLANPSHLPLPTTGAVRERH
jgi:hypothetical protein